MPEAAHLIRQLVSASWVAAPDLFARVERELMEPGGIGMRALLASVPRRLGALAGNCPAAPAELSVARAHWTLTDYVRAAIIARLFEVVPSADQPAIYLRLFEAGEMGEQVSLLRVLSVWPAGEGFLETGVQACRTNARDVFEAIVCENPYLSEHFPMVSFNQAVMKAIFMGVSIARIEGLSGRITPELSRMARDYASERRAAGRVVPDDATYLMSYGA